MQVMHTISNAEDAKSPFRPIRAFVESDIGVGTIYYTGTLKGPQSRRQLRPSILEVVTPSPEQAKAAKNQSMQEAEMKMQTFEMISANPIRLPERDIGLKSQDASLTDTTLQLAAQTAIDVTNPPVALRACRHALVELMLARLSAVEDQQGREEFWHYDEDHTFCDELQHILEEPWSDHKSIA